MADHTCAECGKPIEPGRYGDSWIEDAMGRRHWHCRDAAEQRRMAEAFARIDADLLGPDSENTVLHGKEQ